MELNLHDLKLENLIGLCLKLFLIEWSIYN